MTRLDDQANMTKGKTKLWSIFQNVYSSCLLIFCSVVVMGLIANKQTNLSDKSNPTAAFVVIWISIVWLTMVEGSIGLVGLGPVNPEIYMHSHPVAYECEKIAMKSDTLDRYLMGRQYMVCIMVFLINFAGVPKSDAELWGFGNPIKDIFFSTSLVTILFALMVGQLNTQVNSAVCTLDFCNNYFAVFTMVFALGIEFTGILHVSYLIQMLVVKLSGRKVESEDEPRTWAQSTFFWLRCLMSLAILCFCCAVTVVALFNEQTTMWKGVPPVGALIILVVLMCIVGMLEGMQIAFFAVSKMQHSALENHYFAKKTVDLLFQGGDNNLPGFMIGRQLCVVSCMFFVARVTSVSIDDDEDSIFGAPPALQVLFETGLLGATILTIFGSIAWQLLASDFPLFFLSNPIAYALLRICLFVDASGICSAARIIAAIHKAIAGFQLDVTYIGTAEDRAGKQMADESYRLVGAGRMLKMPASREAPVVKRYLGDSSEKMTKSMPALGEIEEHP
eukprot:CAMPEP_0194374062 /NCGR_PEP_ID=MMETSP0174-20130528/22426_1 /TAXON_ID=216777 /ORGANISM="Proboscia alata, Strain PI-D3" /LENGTH=504 /DNA_ID=CAMNT_0039153393 /DNA_START=141 /DNA_END=1655 /DNA_ORIENTATION=-